MPKVTLIDDDYATEILVEGLSYRGYDARRISTYETAVQSMDEIVRGDLIILDIIMERPAPTSGSRISGDRTTGMELLRAIRERSPKIPVIVFSATNDPELIDAVNSTDHTSFLSKWNLPSLSDFFDLIQSTIGGSTEKRRPRAFIVHGHDTIEKLALKNYLQNTLGFEEPIILHEQPNLGRTIIEKLETFARETDFVFVLLTPDDKVQDGTGTNNEKRRARQNVILELGYFLGVFGRLSDVFCCCTRVPSTCLVIYQAWSTLT